MISVRVVLIIRLDQRSIFRAPIFPIDHHEGEEQGEECFLSEYCNLKECAHLQAACPQKSDAAGQEEFLPCPGSSASHFQWCLPLLHPE